MGVGAWGSAFDREGLGNKEKGRRGRRPREATEEYVVETLLHVLLRSSVSPTGFPVLCASGFLFVCWFCLWVSVVQGKAAHLGAGTKGDGEGGRPQEPAESGRGCGP